MSLPDTAESREFELWKYFPKFAKATRDLRQGGDGKVHIETSSTAISIHEITHVRQSLDAGGLKFLDDGRLNNSVTVKLGDEDSFRMFSDNEIEGYQRQYSYDRTFPGNLNGKRISGINAHSVGGIRNESGKMVYPIINDYSVFLQRRALILKK